MEKVKLDPTKREVARIRAEQLRKTAAGYREAAKANDKQAEQIERAWLLNEKD